MIVARLFTRSLAIGLASGVAFSQSAPPESSFRVFYDEGLIAAWDGGQIGLEGLFQVGATLGERDPVADAFVKRMRPELFGSFDGGYRFRFEPKFTEDEVELEEAWVGRDFADGTLRFGRMKAPFGLEEVRSRRHIHFPRFSILNQFSPTEDHGVFWNARVADFEYAAAVFNGSGGREEDDGKDLALRGMWHVKSLGLDAMQFGLATTYVRQDRDVSDAAIENAFGGDVVSLVAGSRLDGDRVRIGLEWAGFQGPWMAQAEYLWMQEPLALGGLQVDSAFTGGYVELARSLTGEALDFGGVETPNRSWLAAVRLSSLNTPDEFADGAFVTGWAHPGRIDSVSLGLNYIPTRHSILRMAWVTSFYENAVLIDGETTRDEGQLAIEYKLHF